MKKLFIPYFITFFVQLSAFAQMDDKFYFPSKKWNMPDTVSYKEQKFIIDKDTLNTLWLSPKTAKPKATIIYFHGAGGNVSTYLKFVNGLVKDNFQVFMVDFRGYGKSTGKPTHVNIASDAQIIFDAFIKDSRCKNQKIIIYGASMGTLAACNLAKNNQTKIQALVLDGCIASITEIAVSFSPKEQHQMIRQFLIAPYSPLEDIKSVTTPKVLFIHSKEDKEVPFSHYEMVVKNASSNAASWIYVGEHLQAPVLFPIEFISHINSLCR